MVVLSNLSMLLLLSININGLRDSVKREAFIRWLRSFGPDLICIQETHSISDAEISSWFSASGYSWCASHGSNKSSGVCTLYRSSFTLAAVLKDTSGRFLLTKFEHSGLFFQLANIYAPNRNPERDCFFDDISCSLDSASPILLAGDFNAVFDPDADRRGGAPSSSRESVATLADLFALCGCTDVWRSFHPDRRAFSWMKADGSIASRIDLVGCPSDWIPSVSSCDFSPCPFSDHCAITLSFSIPDSMPRGPGFWKFNCALLDDLDFLVAIKDFWVSWQAEQSSFSSPLMWWDVGKVKIKNLAIA